MPREVGFGTVRCRNPICKAEMLPFYPGVRNLFALRKPRLEGAVGWNAFQARSLLYYHQAIGILIQILTSILDISKPPINLFSAEQP